jgi:hypothetical protein
MTTRPPGPVDAPYRVVEPGTPTVYFATERGAATRAAIRNTRDPRAPRAMVEYRDPADAGDPDAWHPVALHLGAHRIPEPGAPGDWRRDPGPAARTPETRRTPRAMARARAELPD